MRDAEQVAEVVRLCDGQAVENGSRGGVYVWHRGVGIVAVFHPNAPYEAPFVYLSPAPVNRHYYVHAGEYSARLCYAQPGEWLPSYRLITAVGCAIRFINDYLASRAL